MNPHHLQKSYGILTLTRQDMRRLQPVWEVVEMPLQPMRRTFETAAAPRARRVRRSLQSRSAA